MVCANPEKTYQLSKESILNYFIDRKAALYILETRIRNDQQEGSPCESRWLEGQVHPTLKKVLD